MYAGARLRRLREERRMTQAALAKSLDLSPSYLNQLERDQRPLTIPVLLKLNSTFDLDVQFFAADSDARLVSDLHEVLVEAAGGGDTAPITEFAELAKFGRAHVGTPVTNAHVVCRLLLEQKNT